MTYFAEQPMRVFFSTSTPLNNGQTYTSSVVVFGNEETSQVQTEVLSDQNGSMTFTFYGDTAGTDVIRTLTIPYLASDGYRQFNAPTFGLAAKWSFTNNSGSNQTDFFYTTKVLQQGISPQGLALNAFVSPTMMATVHRSVVTGATAGGLYQNVALDSENALEVSIVEPTAAFGEVKVAQAAPVAQVDFVHRINSVTATSHTLNAATATITDGLLTLASGTNAAGMAQVQTRRIGRYRPGQGLDVKFTAGLSAGVANCLQLAGPISAEAGIGVGNRPSDGVNAILHRTGGRFEIRTLTVSVAAGGSETATVTLNGVATNVSVVTGSEEATANQLAEADYSANGSGWDAYAVGATVVFVSRTAESLSGTYTLSSTGTAAGTFASTRAGQAPTTENWVAFSAANRDTLDGGAGSANPSGVTLAPANLNVYDINLEYLGAGAVNVSVENPAKGRRTIVHRFEFANARTDVTLSAPTMPLTWRVENQGATTSQTVIAGSGAIFVEGGVKRLGPNQTLRFQSNAIGSSFVPVCSVEMPYAWNDGSSTISNWAEAFIETLDVAADGIDPAEFLIVSGATLTGAEWSYKDAATSPVLVDTSASAYTGGVELRSVVCGRQGNEVFDLSHLEIILSRGERITVVARSVNDSNCDVYAALNWVVDV